VCEPGRLRTLDTAAAMHGIIFSIPSAWMRAASLRAAAISAACRAWPAAFTEAADAARVSSAVVAARDLTFASRRSAACRISAAWRRPSPPIASQRAMTSSKAAKTGRSSSALVDVAADGTPTGPGRPGPGAGRNRSRMSRSAGMKDHSSPEEAMPSSVDERPSLLISGRLVGGAASRGSARDAPRRVRRTRAPCP